MPDCKDCKLKVACLSLDEGRRYRVTNLRSKKHQCKLTGESALIVEIEELPLKLTIDKNQAIDGAVISIKNRDCRYMNCPNRKFCFPPGVKPKMKHQITKVGRKVNCKEGYNLVRVTVSTAKQKNAADSKSN